MNSDQFNRTLLMGYLKSDFIPFRPDSGQIIANLEAAYDQWHEARQTLASLPTSMFWQPKGYVEYLAVKKGGYPSVRFWSKAALVAGLIIDLLGSNLAWRSVRYAGKQPAEGRQMHTSLKAKVRAKEGPPERAGATSSVGLLEAQEAAAELLVVPRRFSGRAKSPRTPQSQCEAFSQWG